MTTSTCAAQAEVLRRPEPVLAEHADAVRVVEDHDRVVLPGERDDLGQPRQVALHREDAVGDHELPLPRVAGRELAAERLEVGVGIDRLADGLREPDRVDDRGVVQRVREDHRVRVGERGDERLVRVPAGDVRQRGLAARHVRQRALQLRVRFEGAADEAHRRCPRAVAAQALDSRGDDARIVGEPEVVVRREDDHPAAAGHLDDRPLRRQQRVEVLERAGGAERVELQPERPGAAHRWTHLPSPDSIGSGSAESAGVALTSGIAGSPPGWRTILQALPDSSSAKATSNSVIG